MPLHLSLVTPEKTLLSGRARSVRLPLYDGSAGIFPGRAPMVGRLGYGLLRIDGLEPDADHAKADGARADGGAGPATTWFVEGGFVQVAPGPGGGTEVSVLTNRAVRPAEIDVAETRAELSEATSRVPSTPDAQARRDRDQTRLRAALAAAA